MISLKCHTSNCVLQERPGTNPCWSSQKRFWSVMCFTGASLMTDSISFPITDVTDRAIVTDDDFWPILVDGCYMSLYMSILTPSWHVPSGGGGGSLSLILYSHARKWHRDRPFQRIFSQWKIPPFQGFVWWIIPHFKCSIRVLETQMH